jgi:hypothetical protein
MTAAKGTVYVLHIEPPLHHAKHYIGWTCDSDPWRRIAEHLSGQGSPLVAAAVAAGRSIDLVLAVGGNRGLERRFHNRHGTRVCPRCRAQHPRKPHQFRLPMIRKGGRALATSPSWLWRFAA